MMLSMRSELAVLDVRGKDRLAWLNGLVTNDVAARRPGEGCYAFVTNVKGRIMADLSILVGQDEVVALAPAATLSVLLAHFDKYLIMEDAWVAARTDLAVVRVIGEESPRFMADLGWQEAASARPLDHGRIRIGSLAVAAARDDLGRQPSFLIVAPAGAAADLPATSAARWTSDEVMETYRIEAGRPQFGRDFDESSLPAETGQLDRAVSFTKGCYLGQEVVARMESHGGVARQMVGLRFESPALPPVPAEIWVNDKPEGRLTSAVHSQRLGTAIGLGIVKSAAAAPGTAVVVMSAAGQIHGVTAGLPFA